MSKLIAELEQQVATGLFPSQNARQGVLWHDGRGMVFEQGLVRPALGQVGLFFSETQRPVVGVLPTYQGGKQTLYYGTRTQIRRWTSEGGVEDRTRLGIDDLAEYYNGSDRTLWEMVRFGNHVVASNGVDAVQIDRNTAEGFKALNTPFAYAKTILATDTQLIAANTDFGEDYLAFCDVDNLEQWVSLPTNMAGDLPQRNLEGGIIALRPLGKHVILYTRNEMRALVFRGAPLVYGVEPLLEGFGPVGKQAVCVLGNQHFIFNRANFLVTDGHSYEHIDTPQVRDFVFGEGPFRADVTKLHTAIVWPDSVQGLIKFSYTTQGSEFNNITLGYHVQNRTWTVFDWGRTAASGKGVFDAAISANSAGEIFQQGFYSSPTLSSSMDLSDESSKFIVGFGVAGFGRTPFGGV